MSTDEIAKAKAEAQRFVRACEAAIARMSSDSMVSITGSRETGAVRRASTDLSRALADLRGRNRR